jgi:ligand-binding sensor domain-containing protein
MSSCRVRHIATVYALLATMSAGAQHIDFRYLGPEDGMRSMSALQTCIDRFGHIWVSTVDALVRYNGSSIDHFSAELYHFIPSESFGHVYCDSKNQIWFCSNKGLIRIDSIRQFNKEIVVQEEPEKEFRFCFENSRGEITTLSPGQTFTRDPSSGAWSPQPWLDSLVAGLGYRDLAHMNMDVILLTGSNKGVLIFNSLTKKKIAFVPLKGVHSAEAISDHEIILGISGRFQLVYVDLRKPDSLVYIPTPDFILHDSPRAEIEFMAKAKDGNIYITTEGLGLISYNPRTGGFRQFSHDPLDPYSIADNYLRHIVADDKGNLIITNLKGINFTNVAGTNIRFLRSFQTTEGDIIEDRVISLAEDSQHRIWFSTLNDVLLYEEGKPFVRRISIPTSSPLHSSFPWPFFIYADTARQHIWVSLIGKGIAVFDEEGNLIREIRHDQYPGYRIQINETRTIQPGPDGMLYVGTTAGFFRMDPVTLAIDTFPDDPALYAIRHRRVIDVKQYGDELWVTISPDGAAYKYNFETKKLKRFGVEDGLTSSRPYSIMRDKNGVILIGGHVGLSLIFPNDSIVSFYSGKGLQSSRIDGIQRTQDGTIWLANSYNLLQYDPELRQVHTVIGEPHLSEVGFQILSSAALQGNRIAFGVHEGFIIVDPNILDKSDQDIELVVFYRNAAAHEILCRSGMELKLGATERDIRFRFAITNLILSSKMLYRYRINNSGEGEWSEPTSIAQVNFNLQPGTYTFEVQAYNGEAWISNGPVYLSIPFPWWQRWWVISLAMLGILSGIVYYWRDRIQKYKRELVIAHQIGELESKALRAQMNPHFVFNCLNAIQECIVTGKIEQAYTYLSKFSRLLRMVLEHSDMSDVLLQDELEVLSLYVSLEKLRFADDLEFTLHLDEDLESDEVRIPPMLIQPHVENALWHGLAHLEAEKKLTLQITEHIPGYIDVVIEDNGVGRQRSMELRQNRLGRKQHTSKGRQMSDNRIQLLKETYPYTSMDIIDHTDDAGNASGTSVRLRIPITRSVLYTEPKT